MSKTKELTQLLVENPDRELIFFYPEESSDHPYTLGHPSTIVLSDYVTIEERVWIRSREEEELKEEIGEKVWFEKFSDRNGTVSEKEEVEEEIQKRTNELDWKKAIVVYIQP